MIQYPSTHPSLIERIQSGEEIAWKEFFDRYQELIRSIGRGVYNFNDQECDDLVQETMLKFFDVSGRYIYRRGEVKFRTYLSRIIKSKAVDYIRRNDKSHNIKGTPDFMEPQHQKAYDDAWHQTVMKVAMEELRMRVSGTTYQAFEMYAIQGRDSDLVCDMLGISKNQLYVAKNRCGAMLKEIIARYDEL